jgi:hypothetical protein
MKIRITVALALLTYPGLLVGMLAAQEPPRVEDTIAGITLGKSTLGDVQKKFPFRLIVDPNQGRHAVKLDGQCELFFDFESDDAASPKSRVTNIELANLGKGAEPGSPCDDFSTGHGLKLSSTPDSLPPFYGSPTNTFDRGKLTVDKFSNEALCEDKRKHAITAQNMFIEWLTDTKVIRSISIGVEPANCDDLRETDKTPRGK